VGPARPETGSNINSRLAVTLAPYAPDIALQLGTDFYGNLSDAVVAAVIAKLAETDPARAALWAPAKLAAMQEREQRLRATLALASAVAEVDTELALSLYWDARKLEDARPPANDAQQLPTMQIMLWEVAHRLKLREAAEHRRAVVAAVEKQKDASTLAYLARSIVKMDPELAEQLLARIPDDAEPYVYQSAILPLARANMAVALRLLERLDKLPKRAEYQDPFDTAVPGVVAELGKTDPAAALALARRVHERYARTIALVMAARFQPKELAISILQEAFAAAPEHPDSPSARIAAMLYALDPQAGLKAFAEAKTKWTQWSRAGNVANWAFYYSRIDPAESRMLLEQEFARDYEEAIQNGSSQDLLQYIGAMAAVDLDRALELLASIPREQDAANSFWFRTTRLERIARYVLAPTSRRYTMRLDRTWYGGVDEDE
jgi:hypothetical protein